jgi:hypothetical protein
MCNSDKMCCETCSHCGKEPKDNNQLPKVTETPLMPKVKDPKPEECSCETPTFQPGRVHGMLICGVCNGTYPGNSESGDKCKVCQNMPRKEVISIQPGDVIVMTLVKECTTDLLNKVGDELRDKFPDNFCYVLAGGNKLDVYRKPN